MCCCCDTENSRCRYKAFFHKRRLPTRPHQPRVHHDHGASDDDPLTARLAFAFGNSQLGKYFFCFISCINSKNVTSALLPAGNRISSPCLLGSQSARALFEMKFRECVSKSTASKKQSDEETDEIQQDTNCVSRRRGDDLDASTCI